jgi:valyl-tRNA synthetase
MIPFVTEEVWGLLSQIAPQRGLTQLSNATESIMLATWPEVDEQRIDPVIEHQFSLFQDVLRAIREIRSRQNIAPKQEVEFSVACSDEIVELLKPMDGYFQSMANAHSVAWGQGIEPPVNSANVRVDAIEVFVDLKNFIDVEVEIERNEKLLQKLQGQIEGKQKKLANENFVARAPEEVVHREREGLAKLEDEVLSVTKSLETLRSQT